MTPPTPPAPIVITAPSPFTPSITDPVAFLIAEAATVLDKAIALVGPSSPPVLAALRDALTLIWVIAPLSAPLDAHLAAEIQSVQAMYQAGDMAGLATFYNDEPLHPNEPRVLCKLCLVLLGQSLASFP